MEDVVVFENVGLRYGRGAEILQDVSFSLGRGSFHYLTGASGAGKSSLLSLLYLGRKPTRGRVLLFSQDIARTKRYALPALRRRIGVVFQDFRLLNHLSALENVALPMRIVGASEDDVQKYVTELLGWVGLGDYLHHKPETLSGGQKQRVAIARAVIGRPELLVADEPTGNVDDQIGMRLMYLLEEMNRTNTTVVVATHNESLIARLPHPRLHLENSLLVQEDNWGQAEE